MAGNGWLAFPRETTQISTACPLAASAPFEITCIALAAGFLEKSRSPQFNMMPTFQKNKEDSSATSIKSSLPGPVDRFQAGSARGYWKRKNLRKFRKLRKKKAPSQPVKERKKLDDFKILQANVAGIGTKKLDYQKLMHDNQVHVALFQETLHRNTNIHVTGYTAYPCKCRNCRGIITYVRNDVNFMVMHQFLVF